jgi:hypothetical protein
MSNWYTPMKVFAVLIGLFGLIYYIFHIPNGSIYMIIGVGAMVASLVTE